MSLKQLRQMAKKLDEMARSVTSDEADLLDMVLRKLKSGKPISVSETESIEKMYGRYLAPREEETIGEEFVESEIEEEEVE